MNLPKSIGKFQYLRETKRYYVFSRSIEGQARDETQYVAKSTFDGGEPPTEVELFIKW